MRQRRRPRPPTGWRRLLFRLPVRLYRLRLGWLFGSRFLLIHHVGRRSGRPRTAFVEVVGHDADAGTWTVASGYGADAQWFQNLLTTPQVHVEVGGHRLPVTARPLPAEDGADAMSNYAAAHPRTARWLSGLMGFEVDGTQEDYRALGRLIPFVRFEPRPGT